MRIKYSLTGSIVTLNFKNDQVRFVTKKNINFHFLSSAGCVKDVQLKRIIRAFIIIADDVIKDDVT